MRGVVSMGMLAALEAMGAGEVFDVIYGASAGAANAASFLAGQARAHVLAYPNDLASRRFFRITSRGPFVDVRYARDVMLEKYGLDIARVQRHATTLHIATTSVATGMCKWFSNHGPHLMDALVASAALPAFYNRPVEINGQGYLDGGVVEPLPVRRAIADDATHVLVLSTVPRTYRHKVRSTMLERWARKRVKAFGDPFYQAFITRHAAYNDNLDIVFGRVKPASAVSVQVIAPGRSIPIFERSKRKLLEAAWHGFAKVGEEFYTKP